MLAISKNDRPLVGALCVLGLGAFALAVAISLHSPSPRPAELAQEKQQNGKPPDSPATKEAVVANKTPILVEVLPAPDTPEKAQRDEQDRNEKAALDERTLTLTEITALILFLQLIVFGYQAFKLRQTVEAGNDQSEAMGRYIAEAARAANAMESVSGSLKINADKIVETVEINRGIGERQREFGMMQMRAYVVVLIGTGTVQDRSRNIKFSVAPAINNIGNTSAHRLRYKVSAAVEPNPLPDKFRFTLPKEWKESATLVPRNLVTINTLIDGYIDDKEIEDIRIGNGKGLFAWGVLIFKDEFKITRRVTFAQQIVFEEVDGKTMVRGFYLPKHNRSN
jgi:hypothetical protein